MTTVLTPVANLEAGMRFQLGSAEFCVDADLRPRTEDNRPIPRLTLLHIFPDGVPVIQPDKPKAVRCVVGRDINSAYLKDVKAAPLSWLRDNTEPGKTYDLVLTEREEGK